MKEIYLIRHGETEWNSLGLGMGSRNDIKLNKFGMKQAKNTGKYLNDYRIEDQNFDLILCSPMLRTRKTAEIICKELNYDFEKGKFKDDYLELPEYIKQNKWYFNVDGVKGFFPKGYEIGTFFAGIIEKTAIWIAEDDPKGFKEFLYDFGMSNIK